MEFGIVILVAFGYFIAQSLLIAFAPASIPDSGQVQEYISIESELRILIATEVIILVVLGYFLAVRDWRPTYIGLRPGLRDTGLGVVIVLIQYFLFYLSWQLWFTYFYAGGVLAQRLPPESVGLETVLLLSIVNPIFEEVFVCGYVITALRKTHSVFFAINVSIALRVAYHLYQGPVGVANVVPLGLLFSFWHVKTGRLWPLIVAHAILDFVGLALYIDG